MTTKYRLVQNVAGAGWVVTEFTDANVIPAMEVRGFTFTKLNDNHRQRAELQGAPIFAQLCGPMWDGDAIRYEDSRANDILST